MTIGEKYNQILEELHDGFWECDEKQIRFDFPDEAIRNATKIFYDVLFDRMYKKMEAMDMSEEISIKMSQDCGTEIRELIQKFTDVDVRNFYN